METVELEFFNFEYINEQHCPTGLVYHSAGTATITVINNIECVDKSGFFIADNKKYLISANTVEQFKKEIEYRNLDMCF